MVVSSWGNMRLKGRNILITAGPTWVPIDSVRVISNTASGETGILLAKKLSDLGAKVTLLLGPVSACCLSRKIKVINFCFFDELKNLLQKELRRGRYDLLIHSAAVADFSPGRVSKGKISSGRKRFTLTLAQTPKIIDSIRKICPGIKLVGFKFEPEAPKNKLVSQARKLMQRTGAEVIVANQVGRKGYSAYLCQGSRTTGPFRSKVSMTGRLIKILGE